MSLKAKSKREVQQWKDKSVGQQVEAVFGKDLADTFKALSKKVKSLEKRLKKLETTEDRQSKKAYAKACEHDSQLAAILQRLRKVEGTVYHGYAREGDDKA